MKFLEPMAIAGLVIGGQSMQASWNQIGLPEYV